MRKTLHDPAKELDLALYDGNGGTSADRSLR
jgi:hypothetical protein